MNEEIFVMTLRVYAYYTSQRLIIISLLYLFLYSNGNKQVIFLNTSRNIFISE